MTEDVSVETLKARRAWSKAFQVLKDYEDPPRLTYVAKLSAISKREKKHFYSINKT